MFYLAFPIERVQALQEACLVVIALQYLFQQNYNATSR